MACQTLLSGTHAFGPPSELSYQKRRFSARFIVVPFVCLLFLISLLILDVGKGPGCFACILVIVISSTRRRVNSTFPAMWQSARGIGFEALVFDTFVTTTVIVAVSFLPETLSRVSCPKYSYHRSLGAICVVLS